jgi:hypothetical protein
MAVLRRSSHLTIGFTAMGPPVPTKRSLRTRSCSSTSPSSAVFSFLLAVDKLPPVTGGFFYSAWNLCAPPAHVTKTTAGDGGRKAAL